MGIVKELIDGLPVDDSVLELERDEESLLTRPEVKFIELVDHENLQTLHFPLEYAPKKFTPPQGVYESDFLRLEWQQMGPGIRQPFYHRNADVDELSYQVCGERTLMTEYGTVELRAGDFSRIPVGVGHDNYGREEIHILFYIPAPVIECVAPVRTAEFKNKPFPEWQPQLVSEVMTECLGGPHCDISVSKADETLLLKHAQGLDKSKLLQVLRHPGRDGEMVWLYKSTDVWLGASQTQGDCRPVYHRHRRAEEIQCQVSGTRTLITQRGILDLAPGDFVSIPEGVSFTNIVRGPSKHISILTRHRAPAKGSVAKKASPTTWQLVQSLRK